MLQAATPHLLTVAEYFSSDIEARTELVEGIVYDVSPRNEPHRFAVRTLAEQLVRALPERYVVQTENAVAIEGWHGKNAPEIDVAVLDRRYYEPTATAADAHAFIEVSDTTYADDRNVKIPMYVRAGVPAWIVNVRLRRVECFEKVEDLAQPHGRIVAEGERFSVLGVPIDVTSLLPPLAR